MKSSLIELMAFHVNTPDYSIESSDIEYEVEIYITGFDMDQIRSMSSSNERQEQWGIYVPKTAENASKGGVRVRKVEVDDTDVEYILTSKCSLEERGNSEAEVSTNELMFDHFKHLADQGLIKHRFVIPQETSTGVKYTLEVDVFKNKLGEMVPWLKVDAELPEGTVLTPGDIPLKYDEIIIVTPAMKADNVNGINERMGELYSKYFRTNNVYV